MTRRRAAFLDRDGVLNERPPPHDYVRDPSNLAIDPRAAEAVDLLRSAGFLPVVVSNQRGVARGLVSRRTLTGIERRLRDNGVRVEAFYYCVHDDLDGCSCRKPRPGLLLTAAAELGLEVSESVLIGDSATDVAAGAAAGCHTIHIAPATTTSGADAVASDVLAAARVAVSLWGATARPPAGTAG